MVLPGPDASLVGKLLDDCYELLAIIGDGGVGVVYSARDVKLERVVAVKVLHESLVNDAGFVGRFQREAQAMRRLCHPHCVAVIDSGVYESRPYLVLEYLPGKTISELLAQGPFTPTRAVYIALQLLETLEYFHSHHVIHRDLKSENVMVDESSGARECIKVLDFGMAKILTGPGADSQLSKIGIVPGTPSVMAPEQIYQLPPDPRIDIYATGILLYEMIVGRRPFSGPNMAAVVKMQISKAPTPPREILGEDALSAELEQVIIKALEKDRVDRFGTAADMAAALRLTPEAGAAAAPALAQPQRQRSLAPAPARRTTALLLAVGGAVLLGAVAGLQPWGKGSTPQMVAAAGSLERARVAPVSAPLPAAGPAPLPAAAPAPVAAVAAIAPVPAAVSPPAAVPAPALIAAVATWAAHRDQALAYARRGQHDAAFGEVKAALADNPRAAGADPALAKVAVNALERDRVAVVIGGFRSNPQLVAALADATSRGATSELRHAALEGLRSLGKAERADTVAMLILDVEQAPACPAMRGPFKELRALKDPRVKAFRADLRARGRKDRHVRCLKRMLRG